MNDLKTTLKQNDDDTHTIKETSTHFSVGTVRHSATYIRRITLHKSEVEQNNK